MFSAIEVSRYFLFKAHENGSEMTNMKLQKLLYYSQVLYLPFFREPLFGDEIQAWEHGPVCPNVYHEYKSFGKSSLPTVSIAEVRGFDAETIDVLDKVWDIYGVLSAFQLKDMSHSEKPWINARGDLAPGEPSNSVVQVSDMESLGEDIIDSIEKNNPDLSRDIEEAITSVMEDDTIDVLDPHKTYEWLWEICNNED